MNPLFRKATRAIQDAVRREFRLSGVSKLVDEIGRATAQRGHAAEYISRLSERLRKIKPSNALQQAKDRFTRSPVGQELAQYAKTPFNDQAFSQIFGALGPLGDVLKAILRPKGKSLTSTLRSELDAAGKLLKAFGFEVIKPPVPRQGTQGKAKAAQEFLEALGFQVTAPTEHPKKKGSGYPIKGLKATPLPSPIQEIESKEAAPRYKRKTIDLDIGLGRRQRIRSDDPLLTGEMIPVTSSNVHSIGFDIDWQAPSIGTLKVRFLQEGRAGGKIGGAQYEYFNVPTQLFQKFRTAASKGKWVWNTLRIRGTVSGHRFDYRLSGITNGYVPRKATLIGHEEWYVKRQFRGERNGEQRVFTSGDDMRARYIPNRGRPEPPNRGR